MRPIKFGLQSMKGVIELKVATLITSVDSKLSNSFTDTDKVDWINDMEQMIFTDHVERQALANLSLVADQASYALVGMDFEDLIKVSVNGIEYKLSSLANHANETYYDLNRALAIDPAPEEDAENGIELIHQWKPTLKTVAGKLTEDLELPDRFINLYRYYLYSMITAHRKEFGEYGNWVTMFNAELGNYLMWVMRSSPMDHIVKNSKRWRWPS